MSECSTPPAKSQCQQTFCGGRIWGRGGQAPLSNIPYRIRDPNGLFSDAYKAAIRAGAAAWTSATHGLITFSECSNCPSRLVSVVPGSGDGVDDSGGWEQLMPLPVDSAASDIPWHRIAHQWGHVIGLDDMYRRPDRDRYATFDPAVWCGTGASLPATCAFSDPTQQPGSPAIASGTFGAYDELSVMNGLPSQGICGNVTADPRSVQPTLGDVSAVEELYYSVGGSWSPFQPIARSTGAHAPPDYQLAPGVDPIGGPAIADWTGLSVEIAVRGTDGKVYETGDELAGTTFVDWAPWRVVADHVNSDPAMVFAGPTTLYLAVRSAIDGTIRLRTRTNGEWGPWASLGAPAVGAASAPAIAALDTQPPTVFVRGGDNLIYHFNCLDPAAMCATSAAATDAWMPMHVPDVGQFIGKPSAAWQVNGGGYLFVSAIGIDRQAWIIGGQTPDTLGDWLTESIYVSPEDAEPGVALATTAAPPLDFFTRNENGLLLFKIDGDSPIEIGGIPISTPAAVGSASADVRLNVAAVIEDHGHPGVWWRSLSTQYTPPCNYNAPGTCAQCGCGLPGTPPCSF